MFRESRPEKQFYIFFLLLQGPTSSFIQEYDIFSGEITTKIFSLIVPFILHEFNNTIICRKTEDRKHSSL
jgi:hypothetical protein